MQQAKSSPAIEFILLIILAFLWGSSYLFIKLALETIPPVTLMAFRVSIAAIFLIAVMAYQKQKFPNTHKTWRMLFIQACFNSIGAWTLLAWGQQYVDSGLATVLNATSPIFVLLITVFITRHEAHTPLKYIGAILGLTGVISIVGFEAANGIGQQVTAQLAILIGAILYACAAIYGKRFSNIPPSVTAATTMIWATVFLVPACFILESPWAITPSKTSIISMLILSIACTGIALLIYFRLVKTIGSAGVASQSYLRVGVGVILGMIVLGETIEVMTAIGVITTVLGVILMNISKIKISRSSLV